MVVKGSSNFKRNGDLEEEKKGINETNMEMKPLLGRSKGLSGVSDGKIKRNKSSPRQQERDAMMQEPDR
jgi:hypothetical protein